MGKEERIKDIELFLFDMDGTIYLGNQLFDFTKELLSEIKKKNARYLFMTNNSSKSVPAYIEKLKQLGIRAEYDDFMTSSQAMVYYLKNHLPNARLYVCGTESFKEELRTNGFVVTENTDETDAVIMGFDTELTFKKLDDISRILTERDLPYIATHPDEVCPTEYGFVPDCGSVCDMIYNATGKRPVVIGKPEALMPKLAMQKYGVLPEHTAAIGDRLATDIQCGINAGCLTILVLSGETTEEILKQSDVKPDVVLENAGKIIAYLN